MARTIEIDDNKMTLVYDFNAFAKIEKELGLGLFEAMNESQIGLNTIRAFLYGGLLKNHRMTPDMAGELIESHIAKGGDFNTLVEDVMKAVAESKLFSRISESDVAGE